MTLNAMTFPKTHPLFDTHKLCEPILKDLSLTYLNVKSH